jgi:uroporphyrinogen-III synthase
LLRTPRTPDPYRKVLEEGGYRVDVVPVLRFEFVRGPALREVLERVDTFGGLIVTSPRAVEALGRHEVLIGPWTSRTLYAVGPETARRARELGFSPQGEEAGSADELADMIIDDPPLKPLLFLSGNRRRDTLPDRLHAAELSFEELVVYETYVRDALVWPYDEHCRPNWIVFFSPSGIDAAEGNPLFAGSDIRTAAIGSTTAAALRDRGWSVHAVAEHPTPDALYKALRTASEAFPDSGAGGNA